MSSIIMGPLNGVRITLKIAIATLIVMRKPLG